MKTILKILAVSAITLLPGPLALQAQLVLVTNSASILVHNSSNTVLSAVSFDYPFWSVSELQVSYTAGPLHCWPVKMHFYVNGVERAVSGALSASESTGFLNLGPVTPGKHVLQLRAEAVPGPPDPCNPGYLISWGGKVDVVRAARACDFEWLDIQASGTNAVISWPNLPCNYILEATTAEPSTNEWAQAAGAWTQVSITPVLVGDRMTVTNVNSGTNTYYRLRLQ